MQCIGMRGDLRLFGRLPVLWNRVFARGMSTAAGIVFMLLVLLLASQSIRLVRCLLHTVNHELWFLFPAPAAVVVAISTVTIYVMEKLTT